MGAGPRQRDLQDWAIVGRIRFPFDLAVDDGVLVLANSHKQTRSKMQPAALPVGRKTPHPGNLLRSWTEWNISAAATIAGEMSDTMDGVGRPRRYSSQMTCWWRRTCGDR